jgi:hypothetical protein
MYKKIWFKSKRAIADSFYSKTGREMLLEEDALSNEEDGFMHGYQEEKIDTPEEDWVIDAYPEELK